MKRVALVFLVVVLVFAGMSFTASVAVRHEATAEVNANADAGTCSQQEKDVMFPALCPSNFCLDVGLRCTSGSGLCTNGSGFCTYVITQDESCTQPDTPPSCAYDC